MAMAVNDDDAERVAEIEPEERRNGRGQADAEVVAIHLAHERPRPGDAGEERVHHVLAGQRADAVELRRADGIAPFDERAGEPATQEARPPRPLRPATRP